MSRFVLNISLGLVACLLPVGCSGDEDKKRTRLSESDYDQSCTVDSDCVIVDIGACDCTCSYAAINVKDEPRFRQDLEQCEPSGECGMCPWMGSREAYCDSGKCSARVPDAGTDGG